MNLSILSIYDSKAEAYHTPLFLQSIGQGLRSFGDACNDPQSEFHKHPEDYTLFHLGAFDPRTGKITVLDAPNALANGVNLAIQGEEPSALDNIRDAFKPQGDN